MITLLLIALFLGSLLYGQFGSIALFTGGNMYLHDIVLVLLLFYAFIIHRSSLKKISLPLVLPIAAFTGMALLSLAVNSFRFPFFDVLEGSLYLLRWVFYGSILFIVIATSRLKNIWSFGIYACGIGFTLLGFIQMLLLPGLHVLLPFGWDEHYGRLFSTLLDPNYVGIILVMIFYWGMYLLKQHKKMRPVMFVGQLMLGIAIVLTYSRSAYIAFATGFIIWLIGSKKYYMLFFLGFLVIVYLIVPTGGLDVNRLDRSLSTESRISNWEYSIKLWTQSPIIGNGYNLLRAIAKRDRVIDIDGVVSRDGASLDSSLLLVLATTGIIGFATYLWFMYSVNKMLYRGFGLTGVAMYAALIIHSFFNNSLFYAWTMILLWILVGLAYLSTESEISLKTKKKK